MRGILIINLGSPLNTEVKNVRKYLDQFLMDKRVIDTNLLMRNFLVRGIILNTRPKKSAAAYESIWTENGSPLIVISRQIEEKLKKKSKIPVALGMRYGTPTIKDGIQELVNAGVTEISLMALYPQYAMSTTETVLAEAYKVQKKFFPSIKIFPVKPFYNDARYIDILSKTFASHNVAEYDGVLLSYHGVPERHILKYDTTNNCNLDNCCVTNNQPQHRYCYRHHCYETTKLLTQKLNLPGEKVHHTFQSRLGRNPWLTPYTDATLSELPQKGVKKILVACPAFVSDCLETLEEIQVEGAHTFKENGGETFHYVPCLNDKDEWIDLINDLCLEAFDYNYDIAFLKK